MDIDRLFLVDHNLVARALARVGLAGEQCSEPGFTLIGPSAGLMIGGNDGMTEPPNMAR